MDSSVLNLLDVESDTSCEARFLCPGESQPVSRVLHKARMQQGWPACRQCLHNEVPESADHQRSRSALRRSPSGIRGPWLNAVDRATAGLLATVFAEQLRRQIHDRRLQANEEEGGPAASVRHLAPLQVAVGYEGSAAAVDLFAGVLPALRRSGCHVVDAGCSSTAALLNLCRRQPELDGVIMVTGAGGHGGDVGLDVLTAEGQPVSVTWRDAGIAVRLSNRHDQLQPHVDPIDQRLHMIRGTAAADTRDIPASHARSADAADRDGWPQLILPQRERRVQNLQRSGRVSGLLSSVDSETLYRHWLYRWWPPTDSAVAADGQVQIVAQSEQMLQRLQWLHESDRGQFRFRSHRATDRTSVENAAADRRCLCFTVGEDDRTFRMERGDGTQIASHDLANWINNSPRSIAAHVTAHVTADPDQRILLVDVAPPHQNRAHDIIADALATIGLVLTIHDHGRCPLP